MKRFTIICSILLLLGFIGTLAYVGLSPDFEQPSAAPAAGGADADAPVWDMTMDDLLSYLEEKGYIDLSTKAELASGVASELYLISGLEIGWWDLESLEEDSEEYGVYQDLADDDGVVLIYGGIAYSMTGNGPFGLHIGGDFAGDVNQLSEDFLAFGR